MTTREHAAAIREAYKKRGWSSRDISVRSESYSLGSSLHITIKNSEIPFEAVKEIAKRSENIRRDERTGDILGGGNRYVSVSYSHEAAEVIKAKYAAVLTAAERALTLDPSDTSLHPIGDSGFLLGHGHHGNGHGFSLWKDSHIVEGYKVEDLAVSLHTRLLS